MPTDLVRNEERWKQAQMDSSVNEEEVPQSRSQGSTPSRYFQTLLDRHQEANTPKPTEKSCLDY